MNGRRIYGHDSQKWKFSYIPAEICDCFTSYVNFTQDQNMKAYRGNTGIALLFL